MKNIIQRSCIGCGTKADKRELIRIVKPKEQQAVIDKTGKLSGKGAYICGRPDCLEKIIKSKKLDKALDTQISSEIYEELRGVVFEQGK